jgi:hypothetical protein
MRSRFFLDFRSPAKPKPKNSLSHGGTEIHGDTEEQPTIILAENAEDAEARRNNQDKDKISQLMLVWR